jgi:hypothetical protein
MCITAPNTPALSSADYEDTQHNAGHPEVVPMTRLQIAMSREIGGWPLYTIVIAAGQVCIYPTTTLSNFDPDHHNLDVECHEFPDYVAHWSKLAR